jgi:hypothetical protein
VESLVLLDSENAAMGPAGARTRFSTGRRGRQSRGGRALVALRVKPWSSGENACPLGPKPRVTSVWRARFMKSSAEWRVYEGGGVYKCNRSLSPRPTRGLYRAPPRLRHGLRRGARLDLR